MSRAHCTWPWVLHNGHFILNPRYISSSLTTGIPEPPRLCELRNDSIMEVICQAGHDGGLQQHFILEAIGATSSYFNNLDSTRSTHEIVDNEISTMNDQVSPSCKIALIFISIISLPTSREKCAFIWAIYHSLDMTLHWFMSFCVSFFFSYSLTHLPPTMLLLRTSLSSILQHRRRRGIFADTMTPINFRQRWLH